MFFNLTIFTPSFQFQWKKKIEKQRAQTRFKAIGSIAKLSTLFINNNNPSPEHKVLVDEEDLQ